MNTGDKNIKGRAILKGPRGGLYVIGPSGAKISTFKRATVAAPPSAASPSNTFTHKGMKFTRMRNATAYGDPVYKKNGVDTYYTIPRAGSRIPSHMVLGSMINKANGTKISLRNYKKKHSGSTPCRHSTDNVDRPTSCDRSYEQAQDSSRACTSCGKNERHSVGGKLCRTRKAYWRDCTSYRSPRVSLSTCHDGRTQRASGCDSCTSERHARSKTRRHAKTTRKC